MSRSKTSSKPSDRYDRQIHVFSGPSGAGKTTLTRQVVEDLSECRMSISFTTRVPRENERDGLDYFFVSKSTFSRMVRQKQFLEYAKVHDHFYGTQLGQVRSLCEQGFDVLLDIDVQGAMAVRKKIPNANLVFILPPSLDLLRERLLKRGTEDTKTLKTRLANAKREMREITRYDYLIVNTEVERAREEIKAIILASRLRVGRVLHKEARAKGPLFQDLKWR